MRMVRAGSLLGSAVVLLACGSDDNSGTGPAPSSRRVRYEIVGTYSGVLDVVTGTSQSSVSQYTVSSLPWSIDTTYASSVTGIVIGGASAPLRVGRSGETANMRILVNGNVVRETGPQRADASGIVVLPTATYEFR
jgi:hypothetical protein